MPLSAPTGVFGRSEVPNRSLTETEVCVVVAKELGMATLNLAHLNYEFHRHYFKIVHLKMNTLTLDAKVRDGAS